MMRTGYRCLLLVLPLLAPVSYAADHAAVSSYAGQESRRIKALSDDDVQGLLAGRGLGFAKAAELNSYPGPMHVLELADKLQLTAEQRERTRALLNEHKQKARVLGQILVDKEYFLDQQFASGSIDVEKLRAAVSEIAGLQGQLRTEHLATHLAQRSILSEEQVRKYDELRGYTGKTRPNQSHQH